LGDIGDTALFLVLHGPAWMLETFAARLQREAQIPVRLAEDGMPVEPGRLLVAPGDWHMVVADGPVVRLQKDPPENYMRPAADPLFRSMAAVFQRNAIGVVLTGMGRDGTLGASEISAGGGVVVCQDPRTAVAPSMPQTVVNAGVATSIVPLQDVAGEVMRRIESVRTQVVVSAS
jgi:two-component system chemotaxis response regulator CheB